MARKKKTDRRKGGDRGELEERRGRPKPPPALMSDGTKFKDYVDGIVAATVASLNSKEGDDD